VKYVVMIWSNPASRAAWDGFPDRDRAAGLRAYAELVEELAASGELVLTEALADPSLGRRLAASLPLPGTAPQPAAGTAPPLVAGDGPVAAAKEHLAGFFLVDCESPERAAEIGARIPEARYGLVEVRPTLRYGSPDL